MATRVRCLTCSKIIECSPYDTTILLKHIKTDHPEIVLPDYDTMDFQEVETVAAATNPKQSTPRVQLPRESATMEEDTFRGPGRKPMYTRKYKVNNPITPPRSPQKRRLYKTSVEKWRAGKGTIYCPKCGANKRPIIRSRSEKMSYSSLGAACILTCWPLCFLPCLFSPPPRDYLHCAECDNFLGMYDKQNNCFRPNRDYVEAGGCQKGCSMDKSSENPTDKSQPPTAMERKKSRENLDERKSV